MAYCPNCAAIVEAPDARCAACGADFSAAGAWKPVKKAPRLDTAPRDGRELGGAMLWRVCVTLGVLVGITVVGLLFGGMGGLYFSLFAWGIAGVASIPYIAYPLYQFIGSGKRADFEPNLAQPNCCDRPSWEIEHDIGSTRGFTFKLGKCANCGAAWMRAWSAAARKAGFEPVSRAEAEHMKGAPRAELKALLRSWGERPR